MARNGLVALLIHALRRNIQVIIPHNRPALCVCRHEENWILKWSIRPQVQEGQSIKGASCSIAELYIDGVILMGRSCYNGPVEFAHETTFSFTHATLYRNGSILYGDS